MGLRDFSGEGGRRSETDSPVSPDSPMRALNPAWARGERGARDRHPRAPNFSARLRTPCAWRV